MIWHRIKPKENELKIWQRKQKPEKRWKKVKEIHESVGLGMQSAFSILYLILLVPNGFFLKKGFQKLSKCLCFFLHVVFHSAGILKGHQAMDLCPGFWRG